MNIQHDGEEGASFRHEEAEVEDGDDEENTIPLLPLDEVEETPRLYKERFFQLFAYFLANFMFGFAQNAFAPVQDICRDMFDQTTLGINFLSMVIIVLNIPLLFITGYALDQLGFRKTVIFFSSIPLLLSGWIRYFFSQNFAAIMVGQTLVGIGMPFGQAASALLSEKWFAENERAVATAVGGLSSILGSVTSSIIAPMMFTKGAASDKNFDDFKTWMLVIAAANSGAFLLTLLLKDEPATPPSLSAAEERAHEHDKKLTLAQTILKPLRNRHFVMLMFLFGCGYGAINAIVVLINQILSPLGYNDNDIGNIGAALGAGVVGAFVFGAATDITKEYKIILKGCAVAAGGFFAWFILTAYLDPKPTHTWMLFGSLGGMGFFGVPLVPLTIEVGVESLFPLSEGIATSFLWLSANLFGLIIVLVATFMETDCAPGVDLVTGLPSSCVYPPLAMMHAMIFLGCMFAMAVMLGLGFDGRLHRLEYERRQHRALSMAHSEAHSQH